MAGSSWASSPGTRRSMRGNRARDTGPELAVRRTLHAAGLRYRLQVAAVPGLRRTIDIAFPRQHVAAFIDGCYWHGCPEHYSAPKANAEFWREKVERNRARDADTTARLEAAGWTVLRFWTHQTPESIAAEIETVVSASQRAIAARSSSASQISGRRARLRTSNARSDPNCR